MSPPLLALFAAFGFGLAGIFLRRALRWTTPLAAAMVSVAFTTVFVCILAVATAPVGRLFTWRIGPFLLAGLLAPGLARLAFFVGVDRVGIARAMPLVSTAPVFAVLVAIAALGERPSLLLLVAVACIAVGGALVAARGSAEGTWRRVDLIFPILAALGFALRDNIFRYGFRRYEEPLLAAAAAAVASVATMSVVGALTFRAGRVSVTRPALWCSSPRPVCPKRSRTSPRCAPSGKGTCRSCRRSSARMASSPSCWPPSSCGISSASPGGWWWRPC